MFDSGLCPGVMDIPVCTHKWYVTNNAGMAQWEKYLLCNMRI